MLKRPNTLKMHRLLQALAECDPRNAGEVRELQADTRRVLGLEPAPARQAPAKTKRAPARKSRKAATKKAVRRPLRPARK